MTGIGDLKRNDVEAAVAYVATVLDEERDLDPDDGETLLMLQDDPEELSAALNALYERRLAHGLNVPSCVVDLGRVRAALGRLDRAVERHPELTTARARERLATWLASDRASQAAAEAPAQKGGRAPRKAT